MFDELSVDGVGWSDGGLIFSLTLKSDEKSISMTRCPPGSMPNEILSGESVKLGISPPADAVFGFAFCAVLLCRFGRDEAPLGLDRRPALPMLAVGAPGVSIAPDD